MTDFQAITGLVGRLPTTYNNEAEAGELGKDEFLKLLVTQLSYQDPMNPMNSAEFSAQLAQFTSVEQLSNLAELTEAGINADLMLAQSINNTLSSTVIGKEVKVATNTVVVQDSEAGKISFESAGAVQELTITIRDANGSVVRTINAGNQPAGESYVEWDGRNNNGSRVADGSYTVELSGTSFSGASVAVTPYLIGTVNAVRYESTGAILVVEGQQVNFGDVVEIREPSGSDDGGGGILDGFFTALGLDPE